MQNENLSLVGKFFRSKWVFFVIFSITISIVIAMVAGNIRINPSDAIVRFDVVPKDARIVLDGNNEIDYHNGSYDLAPGEHQVEISYPDFQSKILSFNLEKNDFIAVTTFLYQEENDFYYYTLRKNIYDYLSLEKIASSKHNVTIDRDTSAEKFLTIFQKNYDLYYSELPIEYNMYDQFSRMTKYIALRAKDDCELTLCIEAILSKDVDQSLAESMLSDKGFDVRLLEIEYRRLH